MCWSGRGLRSDRARPSGFNCSARAVKVLQVITKGEIGGAQSHLLTLCCELRDRQGMEVEVAIGGSMPSPLASTLEASGIQVHHIPSLGNAATLAELVHAVRRMRDIVRDRSPDLLHAHSAMAGVVARLAGALARKPVVYTVHGFAFKAGNPWMRRTASFVVEWLLAPMTQRMVCVSEHERRLARLLPLPPRRITVIHNGIGQREVANNPRALRPAAAAPSIAMVARMAPPKRHDLLLQALAQLRSALGYEVPATFFGGGPQLAANQALAARLELQAVAFTGDVSDIPARLLNHSIFVLASDHEGLPISIIEAMQAGMAIVASDLPGIRELLPDATCARLVPPDASAWAQTLRQLVESAPLRSSLGQTARRRYEQHYTAQRMGLNVQATYEAALVRSPDHP